MNTVLTLDDVAVILGPFDLRPRGVEPIERGTINSNYRVETSGGPLFLRVNEGKGEADMRYEEALLWHLGTRGFPTPQPLRLDGGDAHVVHRGQRVTLFPWVGGVELHELATGKTHLAEVGRVLAELHRAAADFAPRRAGIYTLERIRTRIERLRNELRIAEVWPLLDHEGELLERARVALPGGTIHGDLFPDNVLWEGDRLRAVIDFEQASTGAWAYDLAVVLLSWCWRGGRLDLGLARALLAGYEALRRLDTEERAALWVEARIAALRFTVTRITDVFLPGADRPGKEYHAFLGRLERLRQEDFQELVGSTS